MDASSIVMMVLGIGIVWGGLVVSVLHAAKKSRSS